MPDNDTKAIITEAYPEVDRALSIPANINKWKRFMMDFVSKRQTQLYANAPAKQMYYGADDVTKWFECTGINKTKIKAGIKGTFYYPIGNYNPQYAKDESTVALLCMVRYFLLNHKDAELKSALLNISFSGKFYPSVFYKSFRYEPAEYIMEYVINSMLTNKFDLVKQGNVVGAVMSVSDTWAHAYDERFERFDDNDVSYLVQQLHNRLDSFVHNIAILYYEAYKNKDAYITYDSDDVSEDNYHLADNDSFKITNIVSNAIKEITGKAIDFVNCKRASNDMVKFNELKAIIDSLVATKENIPLIQEYLTLMVSLYFQDNKLKDIKDIAFITYSIRPTPNSKNKYILRKKELLDQILLSNAENFARRRNRAATEQSYYRAFNAYLALICQKANK